MLNTPWRAIEIGLIGWQMFASLLAYQRSPDPLIPYAATICLIHSRARLRGVISDEVAEE